MSKAEYAQASRDALQKYLVELIRAVVSWPVLSSVHARPAEGRY